METHIIIKKVLTSQLISDLLGGKLSNHLILGVALSMGLDISKALWHVPFS